MTKSILVNISGFAFYLDEDAYGLLDNYLTKLKKQLQEKEADFEEIYKDIENSIAYQLDKNRVDIKEVIDTEKVKVLIKQIGETQDNEFDSKKEPVEEPQKPQEQPKKLFRDTDNKIIAGVCSGLANYFNVDVSMVRILAVVGIIIPYTSFVAIVGYLLLWAITPIATNATNKLEMQGKLVNVKNISKFNSDEDLPRTSSNPIEEIDPARKILGIIITLISGLIILWFSFRFLFVTIFSNNIYNFSLLQIIQYFIITILSSAVYGIPLFFGLKLGIWLTDGKRFVSKKHFIIFTIIWIISLILISRSYLIYAMN